MKMIPGMGHLHFPFPEEMRPRLTCCIGRASDIFSYSGIDYDSDYSDALVFRNGVRQVPKYDYSNDGHKIVSYSGPFLRGDIVEIR